MRTYHVMTGIAFWRFFLFVQSRWLDCSTPWLAAVSQEPNQPITVPAAF